MPKIRMLSDDIIGKIAAGEVVERPAAAIKEMVENSLDAGASAVSVEIRDGGISYIRVTDNGCGIPEAEIRMAFERHATSKIASLRELETVATLGFRGEALASISAVSCVTCTTRTADAPTGIRAVHEGGRLVSVEEAAGPVGTSMVVRDLFFNAPVRLKFLKKPQAEAAQAADVIMRLILSHPEVSFRLVSQGKTVYHSAGDGRLESAVFSVYGTEMLRAMRRVEGHQGGVLLKGFVGVGESGRGSRSHESFFINGRCLRSSLLSSAVEEGCRERVMIGKYPVCVLHLTLPYEAVDVNVHPNKLEARFADEQAVFDAVSTLVREALAEPDPFARPEQLRLTEESPAPAPVSITRQARAPSASAAAGPGTGSAGPAAAALAEASAASSAESAAFTPASTASAAEAILSYAASESAEASAGGAAPVLREAAPGASACLRQAVTAPPPQPRRPVPLVEETSFLPDDGGFRFIGTVFDTYILLEYRDQLMLIDQHAVHERLLFDRLMAEYDRSVAAQELLIPQIVPLTRQEQAALEENRALLEGLGFAVEPFGENEAAIRAVPMILGEPQAKDFLLEALDRLTGESRSFSVEKRRAEILQTACKHAVKGGEKLPESVLKDLVKQMAEQNVTPTCPHGRPLVVALSHGELDRKFRRVQ
ncbi:MAG: DNA mismatch repair endonuclease MutL [Clostridia bacterium]|nr:DNA mismatch repair endonuclease MutL [Clostridia bacterium]